jgi:hypothetical protein
MGVRERVLDKDGLDGDDSFGDDRGKEDIGVEGFECGRADGRDSLIGRPAGGRERTTRR